jgi:hypothetical protein
MEKKDRPDPQDVVKAFRKTAKELGCCQSDQRFQEALFSIGRYKPGSIHPTAIKMKAPPMAIVGAPVMTDHLFDRGRLNFSILAIGSTGAVI